MNTNTNQDLSTSLQYTIESFCKYPGCNEERAYKITGELHNFCMYHREKASENQRRYAQNKRERKRQKKAEQISSSMANMYQEKYEYMNTMPVYPVMNMGYPNHTMVDPTSVDLWDGFQGQFYPEPMQEDDIVWLADYLYYNQCPLAENSFMQMEISL